MTKNVLVFPCGSEIGLELHRSLNKSTHFKLVGASSVSDHGEYVYEDYIPDVPNVEHPEFIKKIKEIIKKYDIDFIFPAHDSVVLELARYSEDLSCEVITSPFETCRVSRSKSETYEALKDVIKVPRQYRDPQDIPSDAFPVFIKPDVGQGSKGTLKAGTISDVVNYVNKTPDLLVMEYLPGKEYTIDCFTDKNGELLVSDGRERARISNGISVRSRPVKDERFNQIAKKINESMEFRGVWFFQLKEDSKSDLVLLEVATRIAGTMGLMRARGVNLALMSLFDRLNLPVTADLNSYDIEVDRALENKYKVSVSYRHVYVDFDDLLVLDGKINTDVVKFLFQCINEGVAIHLITRHLDDIHASLSKRKLTQLFDEVIWIQDGSPKSQHIIESDAIFIDDSFAERKEVKNTLGLPVFDAHMIECLVR